ncbi:MAG: serine protease [Candidatus Poribacteria bacterium]|nr:serine protease [Candidatus Poribacteria bacterium]
MGLYRIVTGLLLVVGLSMNVAAMDSNALYENAKPSLGLVISLDADRVPVESASGFFVNDSGALVTSLHALAGASSVRVKASDGRFYDATGVIAFDAARNLVILQTLASGFKPLTAADAPSVGTELLPVGSPDAVQETLESATLNSSDGERITLVGSVGAWTDGGPVLNSDGRAVGIITNPPVAGLMRTDVVPYRAITMLLSSGNATALIPIEEVAGIAAPRTIYTGASDQLPEYLDRPIPIPSSRETGTKVIAIVGLLFFIGLGVEATSGI